MKTISLTLLGFVLLVFTLSCQTVSGGKAYTPSKNETAFYVSPDGNDAWQGSLPMPNRAHSNGPFATIAKARDAVRALKSQENLTNPVTVYLRQGTYFLNEPLVFAPQDSGTKDGLITYSAYRNEKPVISGGRELTFPAETGRPVRALSIPEVKNGDWYFHQLFVNGTRSQRARIPDEGYFNMEGPMKLEGPAEFTFRKGDIQKEWESMEDVFVIGLAKWAEIIMPVQQIDEISRKAVLSKQVPPSNWRGAKTPRYWIENAPEGLDQPGEWRLEKETGTLSYIAKPAEENKEIKTIAPKLEHLIVLDGKPSEGLFVHDLTFRGLTFRHSKAPKLDEGYPDVQAAYNISAAFSANGANDCRIESCVFDGIGNYAVSFAQGCKRNTIVGNTMTDLGAGGVKIGEPSRRTEPNRITEYNIVSDNHIYDIGNIYPAAVGVWVGQSNNITIAHNHIHDTFYTGISVGWTWGYSETGAHHNTVEYNLVHDIGQGVLSDMGGIYTLGTQEGTVIRNNIFHHVDSYDYGGWGIYPDEGSTHILIENNITYRTKCGGFHQHYGKENTIRNNIFTFAKLYQVRRTRAEEHLSLTFEGNIVLFDEGELLEGNWTGNNYKFDRNLYWNTRGEDLKFSKYTWEEWKERGNGRNSRIADPCFRNAEAYDFRLRPDSPALEMGFVPIDVSKVGPRKPWKN